MGRHLQIAFAPNFDLSLISVNPLHIAFYMEGEIEVVKSKILCSPFDDEFIFKVWTTGKVS